MRFAIAYVTFLVAFGLCDAVWLSTMTPRLYQPALGEILAKEIRLAPAILFYLGFPLGVIYFGVIPALRDGSAASAVFNGALIGLLAYATYDLTNYATLRDWTLTITLADIAYGTIVAGFCSWLAYAAVRYSQSLGWV